MIRSVPLGVVLLASWATMAAAQARDPVRCLPTNDTTALAGIYTLMHDGGRLLCAAPSNEADDTNMPCMRIGQIHVGQARSEAEAVLGHPDRQIASRNPARPMYVYFVMRDTLQGLGAYYVMQYEKTSAGDVAYSVQLTGDRPPVRYDFSCLELGDSARLLRRQLGAPENIESFNDQANNRKGDIWYYDRNGVSVELLAGLIYSVRLWRPDGVEPRRRRLGLLAR